MRKENVKVPAVGREGEMRYGKQRSGHDSTYVVFNLTLVIKLLHFRYIQL